MNFTFISRAIAVASTICFAWALPAVAQELPPQSTYQAMLDHGKKTGWIAFRNYDGRQLVYFTHLQTMHCRLREIRYSINSDTLDKRFKLVNCNPQLPFSLPSNSGINDIAIRLSLNEARYVSVQVVWNDGRESEIVTYQPCTGVGESSCAALVE